MQTLAPASICRHAAIRIRTALATQFVDLTDDIEALLEEAPVRCGLINIQTLHTTTAIVVNEHEPLLLVDFATILDSAVPSGVRYPHDDPAARTVNLTPDERVNGHAHCRALLLGTSTSLNIVDSRLRLGRWQRVFFVELDGPREREISVVIVGESVR